MYAISINFCSRWVTIQWFPCISAVDIKNNNNNQKTTTKNKPKTTKKQTKQTKQKTKQNKNSRHTIKIADC